MSVLPNNHILFLTDRNNLQDQAWRAFSAFASDERVVIDKEVVRKGEHQVGKIFFANYQNLDEELDGKKLFEHYSRDFFDLVIVDECHRSGFGDWFPIFEHFDQAFQLGLTATPREIEDIGRPLSPEEQRRDTYSYFTGSPNGEPAYTYSLKQAIEDGYLVPYLLEERLTNLDEDGYVAPDGTSYTTANFERDIRLPERTRAHRGGPVGTVRQVGPSRRKGHRLLRRRHPRRASWRRNFAAYRAMTRYAAASPAPSAIPISLSGTSPRSGARNLGWP